MRLKNPFGYDSNDLPSTQLFNKIRMSTHDLPGWNYPLRKRLGPLHQIKRA